MTGTYLLIAVGLLVANGFFVGAEFALVAARRTRIEQLASEGYGPANAALKSVRELSFMLAAAQLGITMASLGLGFVAEPAVARVIESGLEGVELPSGLIHSASVVVALAIVVFFHMVIGEMAPKNIAIAEPERSALWLAVPFRVYANLFRPLVRTLNALSNAGVRLLGVEPRDEVLSAHGVKDIEAMIAESARAGMLGKLEERLLSGAAEFGERDAASAMIPRTELVAVLATITPAELEELVVETGHTRLPVFVDNLDNILGFLHAKDLLRIPLEQRGQPLPSRLIRQMLVVPESRKLPALLFDMRRQRNHFALVIDEHGGTAGIVTIEDVVEELVGEIRDEYDVAELGIQRLGDKRFLVPGTLRIDEAADRLGVELPEGDYETVAGFLMDKLGHVPKRRDFVDFNGWRLRVRDMQRRRVVRVLIEPAPDRHV
ncbi:MAG: hemolysin family protein [Actinomycetota bacterium]